MTQRQTHAQPTDDEHDPSASLAAFQRLRDQAADAGIAQDVPLNPAGLQALFASAPGAQFEQLKELANAVREALALAETAASEFTRDEDAAAVDAIVEKLRSAASVADQLRL